MANPIDESTKLVWPDVPRTAFEPAKGPDYACALGWMRTYRGLDAYWLGYADAAKLIFAGISGNGRANEVLLFPLANTWRHCFELQLKAIIWRGREMENEGSGSYPKREHGLMALWELALPFILPYGTDEAEKAPEIVNVQALLVQLHAVDERGQAFRYPTLTSGVRSLGSLPDALDLEGFHVAMLAVFNFLSSVDGVMVRDHEQRLEYEAEKQAEYEADMRAEYERDYRDE